MAESTHSPRDFTRTVLPWLIVAAAVVLYSLTLSHWVTFTSLHFTAKVTGWEWWYLTVEKPVALLLTYPLRLLPANIQVIGLNVFMMVCSALTLGLLARSVSLLPQDRTREQRQRARGPHALLSMRGSWVPVVLAVTVCGLQLTFWEHATAATGEALDILFFAYVIRCLLEYRVSRQESWVYRMAFVYGVAATNNWAMIGFLPFFIIALIWIKGRSFFSFRPMLLTLAFGLLGLLFYFVLPASPALNHAPDAGFMELLRMELGAQKNILLYFPKGRVLLLALTSILPVMLMGIRWPSSMGDTNAIAAGVANFVFRLAHVALLLVIVWVAFDQEFSPRKLGYGFPFLTFYYLGALAVGYYSGYLLVIFGTATTASWERPSGLIRAVGGLVVVAVWAAAVAVPVALFLDNHPSIQANNSPVMRQFAQQLAQTPGLPNNLFLSGNLQRLLLFNAAHHGEANPPLSIDLQVLPNPKYYRQLVRKFPGRLPALTAGAPATNSLTPVEVAKLIDYLNRTNQVYLLEPAYGQPFLELQYLEPRGLIYALKSYGTNPVTAPPMTPDVIAANQTYWNSIAEQLPQIKNDIAAGRGSVAAVGSYYSAGLDYWGVEIQKLGRYEESAKLFARALEFNPENASARINLVFNERWRAPDKVVSNVNAPLEDQLRKYPSWNSLLAVNGPIDEPQSHYKLGTAFAQSRSLRQAALHFLRAQTLSPTNLPPRLALGEVYLLASMQTNVLELVRETRAMPAFRSLAPNDDIALTRLEAFARLKTDKSSPEQLLLGSRKKYPDNISPLESLVEVYIQSNRITNALETVETILKIAPNNLSATLTQGAILLQSRQFERALASLDKVLAAAPNHPGALIYRANANLGAGKLPAAERDFQAALLLLPDATGIHLGLAEVATQQKKFPEAIKEYEAGLRGLPENSPQAKQINQRLNELKARKP